MDFIISLSTDVGVKKKVNQDSSFVRKISTKIGNMVFAVICDGMGGYEKGELASASIIAAFTEWMYNELPVLSRNEIEDCAIREQWTRIINDQNKRIRMYGEQNRCKIGSTVTAMLITSERFFLLNIGDTRAYVIDDRLSQLTVDHTLIAEEVERGNISPEEAEKAPIGNILTRCVGIAETAEPDMFFGDVKPNTAYILCSDGFRHYISATEMVDNLFCAECFSSEKIKRGEEYLIELNKLRGETDNISVITVYAYDFLDFCLQQDITCIHTAERIEQGVSK